MPSPSATAAASSNVSVIHLPAVDSASVEQVRMQLGRIKDALPKFGVTISSHLADPVPDPPPHCEMFTMAVLLIETVLEKRPEAFLTSVMRNWPSCSRCPASPNRPSCRSHSGGKRASGMWRRWRACCMTPGGRG
ncbi:hypothetical protein GCM10025869_11820 [Homoserinibacter gongjuensis]|uniref:Uncharacterized protein n=1 Tax=Homoserinibacter gongjuensis TaxID=1162968 RepID=A0ABQ6JRB9_9MICO|nr:hypothetical protein GCM10025869_11820 [Homoserinibacter gongjuensis]